MTYQRFAPSPQLGHQLLAMALDPRLGLRILLIHFGGRVALQAAWRTRKREDEEEMFGHHKPYNVVP